MNKKREFYTKVRSIGMKACSAHTLTHEEIKKLKEDLEKATKQAKELRKLMKQYVKLAKKAGLSNDPEKAITQIQNFIKILKGLKEWQELTEVVVSCKKEEVKNKNAC